MKKIFLILSIFCGPQALLACGWGPIYNQFSMFFHPVSAGDKMYPFQFVADEFLYDFDGVHYNLDHKYAPKDYDWNNKEWKMVLKTDATLSDINDFVYHYPYEHLKSLYYHLEKGNTLVIPDSMQRNSFTAYFTSKKDFETLGYLMYAKQCEQEHNKRKRLDQWDYETYTNQKADEQTFKLIKNGTQLFDAAQSEWIKKRYAFQFIRLAHYFRAYEKADALYTKYVSPRAEGNMLSDYWLWGLRGGMLRRLNRKAEAQVCFAKTVVRSPDKFLQAYFDFRHNEISNEEALPYCKNYIDSADVLFVSSLGVSESRIAYLEKLYDLQPNSEMIPLLLSRELSKLEMTFLPGQLLSPTFKDWNLMNYQGKGTTTSQEGLATLYDLSKRIVREGKRKDIRFLKNYTAYLAIAAGDFENARKYLQTVAMPTTDDEIQTSLLDWLLRFKENEKINEVNLFSFLIALEQADRSKQSVQSAKYHFLKYFVAPYFEASHQPIRKAYALLKAEVEEGYWTDYTSTESNDAFLYERDALSHYLAFQLSFENLEQLLSFEKAKKSSDPFIQYATSHFDKSFGRQTILSVLTRKYVRNFDWEKAKHFYTQGQPEDRFYEDPLLFRTKDEIGYTYEDKSNLEAGRIYSTTQILDLAQSLQLKLKDKKAIDLYNYGMLLYHLSYYGRLENMSVYNHRNYGVPAYTGLQDSVSFESNYYAVPSSEGMKQGKELDNYYNLSVAQSYFEEAYKTLKTEKERAQCAFMLALCWQKTSDMHPNSSDDYVTNSLQNPYFFIFKNEYEQTSVYQEAFGTCGYLRFFAGQ